MKKPSPLGQDSFKDAGHAMKKKKETFIKELNALRGRIADLDGKGTTPEKGGVELDEARLEILESMSDGFMLLEMNGKFIFVNQAIEKFMGYKKQELIGKYFSDFVPDVTKEEEFEKMKEIIRLGFLQGITPPFEYTHISRDGRETPVSCIASFLRDEQGHPAALIVCFRDITQWKRTEEALRQSEERYRILVKTSPDATTVIDLKGTITEISQRTLDQFGFDSPEEMIGRSIYGFIAPEDHEKTRDDMQETLKKGFKWNFDYTFLRKNGTRFIGEVNATLAKGMSERSRVVICTIRDITDRVEAENTRRENEERFRALFEGSLDAIFLTDPESGNVLDANPSASELLLMPHENIVGLHYTDLLPARLRNTAQKRYADYVLDKDPPEPAEMTVLRSDGSERHVEILAQMIQIDGRPVLHGVFRDITERRKTEEARRESEAKFRSLAEQSPNMIFINLKGCVVYVNDVCEEMMGYTKEEFYSPDFDFICLVAPESRDLARATFEQHMKRQEVPPYEYNLVAKSGTKMVTILATKLISFEGEHAILGIITDITDRKIAEEALRESETKFRSLAEQSPNMIFIHRNGRVLYINQKCEEIMGHPRETFYAPDFNFLSMVAPESHDLLMSNFRLHQEGREVPPSEYTFCSRDGKPLATILSTKIIQYEGEQAVLGIATDITARKRAEGALRESEERYRTLVETSPDAVTVTTLDGRITEVSQQTLSLHGALTPEEMIGKNAVDLIHPKDHERAVKNLAKTLEEGFIRNAEYTLLKKDGNPLLGEMNASVVRDANGNPKSFIASVRDITQRKQIEAELANAQKLESLGILAGGIAHDFNNILSAISTNLSMARMFGDLEEDVEKMLSDAETATLRAQSLTHQLLTFSKGGTPVKTTVPIRKLINETIAFALSGSNVRYEEYVPQDLWPVDVDEGQIGQAIHNLIINADQAMPEGGMIRIDGENLIVDKGGEPPLKGGRYVKISITDQGIGIPEKHLHKIFDPFFSTKYKGSGLGLATCFSIVNKHDGHIFVDSKVGVGTTFSLLLPASKRIPRAKEKTKKELFQGKGKILLVDDEEIVRKATGKALTRMGYVVKFAEEGAEGIRIYKKAREAGKPFDAVIMDLTIPGGMGGREAIGKILEADPQAKVIVSSGYANNPVMSDFKKYGFSGVVKKPYRIHELGEAIRKIWK